jgi:hypothetical protein
VSTVFSQAVQRTAFPRNWICPGCRTTYRLRPGIHWCSCRPEPRHILVELVRVPVALGAKYGTNPMAQVQDPYAELARRVYVTKDAQ